MCLSACLSTPRSREQNIALQHFFYQRKRALPGDVHHDKFLTRMQSGKRSVCLSQWFERTWCTMYETMPTIYDTEYRRRLHLKYDEPIREWASIFLKALWILKCIVNYGPILEWSPSLDLWGHFINDEAICKWTCIIAKILQVFHYPICYGPIYQWATIFAQGLRVIQYNIYYGSIHEWEPVFPKLLWVVKYTVNYGLIHEWASSLHKLRVHLCWLHWIFKESSLMIKPFVNGHQYSSKYYGLLSAL